MKAVVAIAWTTAGLAIALYEALIYLPISQGSKWSLLMVEVVIAAIGFFASVVAVSQKKKWHCVVCLVICGYVLYRQLVG